VEAVLGHFGHYWWDVCHLVTTGFTVLAYQRLSTATAHLWFDIVHFLDVLDRYQFPSAAFVSWLRTAFASALASLARLSDSFRTITGRRL
jgi:hypothetical protein